VRTSERERAIREEREFLRLSLQDAERELLAGDLAPKDFEVIVTRDRHRLAALEAELAALDAATQGGPAQSLEEGPAHQRAGLFRLLRRTAKGRHRWLMVAFGTAALVAGIVLLVLDLAAPRLPGAPLTGGADLSRPAEISQQLEQASILVNEGSLSEALIVYGEILKADPRQPEALAESGWIEWEAGFSSHKRVLEAAGTALVRRALTVAPHDEAAHLFLGTIELEGDHDPMAAVAQYELFLAEHPPKATVASAAALLRKAYSEAGVPLPSQVPSH